MLHQEHVCVEIGSPLLTFLRDSKVAQGVYNIRLHHLPEKARVICPQVSGIAVFQFVADSCLAIASV
jgi:hypothetical protein